MHFDFLLVSSLSDQDILVKRETARKLEARGYSTALVSPAPKPKHITGDAATRTFDLKSLAAGQTVEPQAIEERFGVSSTRFLCHTEQTYFHIDYETALKRAQWMAAGVERLLSEHSFEYAFQARGGELFRLLIYFGITESGGENIWTAFSPFENSVVFSTGLHTTWDSYQTIPYPEMTEQQRTETRQFMDAFKRDQKRYSHAGLPIDEDPETVVGKLRSAGSAIKKRLWPDYPRHLPTKAQVQLTRNINERVNMARYPTKAESRQQCNADRYVLFPLQFPEESRLTLYSPEFYNQAWIIEYLSRTVPHDTQVFVKQHPNHVGQQSPLWIHRLSKLPNVRFLHPKLNAHKAIDHAAGVVVTNNTVGFESLFYSTPLIVLGDAFYRDTPAVWTADELNELSPVIRRALMEGVSEEARVASIHSLREAVFEQQRGGTVDRHASGAVAALVDFITSDRTSG